MSGQDFNDSLTSEGMDPAVATATPPDSAADMAADLVGEQGLEGANLDLLMDVDMKLTVELGQTRLKFRDVLNLTAGSVVELAKLTSEPVDIMVNGALLATGEVVVVDDHFAIRITKLLNRVERLKRVL